MSSKSVSIVYIHVFIPQVEDVLDSIVCLLYVYTYVYVYMCTLYVQKCKVADVPPGF